MTADVLLQHILMPLFIMCTWWFYFLCIYLQLFFSASGKLSGLLKVLPRLFPKLLLGTGLTRRNYGKIGHCAKN